VDPVRLIVYSDYLCPWCYNAAHRLQQLRQELGEGLELEWRSYLLRPRPEPGRDLAKFVRYTHSWLRPAAEPDAPVFRVWESRNGPPSHSLPAHQAAKAAQRLGDEAFAALHPRLLRAYFEQSRDISDSAVLRALWAEAGLPEGALAVMDDPELIRLILSEHAEAEGIGITGVPALRVDGTDAFVLGAQPLAVLRRWVGRLRAGVLDRQEP